jgi:deoxyribose-phosphate aldolase
VNLNSFIDHTLLKPSATQNMIDKLCEDALHHQFFSVCVNPCWVERAASHCQGTSVKVCTVIGFPTGANLSHSKADETKLAIQLGAQEIDMVMNIGFLKSGLYKQVKEDIMHVIAEAQGMLVKVILETCLLSPTEKVEACQICLEAGADFVKTSTGFSIGGATLEDVALLRTSVGKEMGVKASGGISNREVALAMIKAGANRLGTSSGISLSS